MALTRVMVRSIVALALLAGTVACSCADLMPWQGDQWPERRPPPVINDPAPITQLRNQLAAGPREYTATYQVLAAGQAVGSGTMVTVTGSAGAVSTAGPGGRYVRTPKKTLFCPIRAGRTRCQRSGPAVAANTDDAARAAVAGKEFLSLSRVLELLDAAATAKVQLDVTSVWEAGREVPCLRIASTVTHPKPRLWDTTPFKKLTVCRTRDGVLSMVAAYGKVQPAGVDGWPTDYLQLERYVLTADPAMFDPPNGASVVDVDRISPQVR